MFGPAFFFCFFIVLYPQAQKELISCAEWMDWTDGWRTLIHKSLFCLRIKKKKTYSVFIMIARQHPDLFFSFWFCFPFFATLPTLVLRFLGCFVVVNLSFLDFFYFRKPFAVADNYSTDPTLLNFCFVME
jgi:hypothetical protein